MKFAAVAFDLDGTLYPNYRLNIRLIPFLLREPRLVTAMGRARSRLRGGENSQGDFYRSQARLMGEILKIPEGEAKERTERLIYRGWEPHFRNIRLFPHARETLDAFRTAGLKMGLLSDFPPETKLRYMGLDGYWEVALCSEATGRLKPDPLPFLELARKMGAPPEGMLYVGNSVSYDIAGAAKAGMKTALIRSRLKTRPRAASPDFIFHDYRQLRAFVLG